jgi:putative membrane protein
MEETMKSKPYPNAPYMKPGEQLILRDVLAIDRTRLANERTLLAWVRTAVMLLVSGMTLMKLFAGVWFLEALGMALIPVALVTVALGLRRYFQICKLIRATEQE